MFSNNTLCCAITALALATIHPSLPCQTIDGLFQASPPTWNTRTFSYTVNNTSYPVYLCGSGCYDAVNSVPEALALLQRDDSPSFLAVGDFSEEEMKRFHELSSRVISFNPRLLAELEPIFLKGEESDSNWASSNLYLTPEEVCASFSAYVGKRETLPSYDDFLTAREKYVIFVPFHEQELPALQRSIEEAYFLTPRQDGYDIIFLGTSAANLRLLFHEHSHLVFNEQQDLFPLLRHLRIHAVAAQPNASPAAVDSYLFDSTQGGKSYWSFAYVRQRRNEVNRWIAQKQECLERVISFLENPYAPHIPSCQPLSSSPRIDQGLRFFGKERFLATHRSLLELAGTHYQWTEWFAENSASILMQDQSYAVAQTQRAQPLKFRLRQESLAWTAFLTGDFPSSLTEQYHSLPLSSFATASDNHGYGEKHRGYELWFLEDYLRNFGN